MSDSEQDLISEPLTTFEQFSKAADELHLRLKEELREQVEYCEDEITFLKEDLKSQNQAVADDIENCDHDSLYNYAREDDNLLDRWTFSDPWRAEQYTRFQEARELAELTCDALTRDIPVPIEETAKKYGLEMDHFMMQIWAEMQGRLYEGRIQDDQKMRESARKIFHAMSKQFSEEDMMTMNKTYTPDFIWGTISARVKLGTA